MPIRAVVSEPGDERCQELGAGRTDRLGLGHRGGSSGDADVRDRVGVGVVEVERMAEHRIRKRRCRRRQTVAAADHRRLGTAAVALEHVSRGLLPRRCRWPRARSR